MFSPYQAKQDFPIFEAHPALIYLDNAATTQRPREVLQVMQDFYTKGNASVHRGAYGLSHSATVEYEGVRKAVASFLHASSPSNIAFTQGTTQGINIVARSFLGHRLQAGDNIVVSIMEHHANLIPWQQLAKQADCELRVIPIDGHANLDLTSLDRLIDVRTAMLSVVHISNTLGTINPIAEIIELAHRQGIPVLIDAAQSAAYYELNAQSLDYDFLVFSGHKVFGPFGTGVLYASDRWVGDITPYHFGGGIVKDVTIAHTDFTQFPHHLEAGTPNVAGVIGLGAAIHYVRQLDRSAVRQHLKALVQQSRAALLGIQGVQVFGHPSEASGIISFGIEGIHPHDIASFLDQDGIAVRAGMHCTQPLLKAMQLSATARASFSIYNTKEDVAHLAASVQALVDFWE